LGAEAFPEADKVRLALAVDRPRPTCTNARRALLVLEIDCRYDVFHDKLIIKSPLIGHFDNLDHSLQILRTGIEKALRL
jgi:hypothetical protein